VSKASETQGPRSSAAATDAPRVEETASAHEALEVKFLRFF
jgi:hypothetical protein